MARIFVWAILTTSVVAEAIALIRLSDKIQTPDGLLAPKLGTFDDISRRATAQDQALAALDARLRAIEGAQAGESAKTDGITKLLTNLQPHPPMHAGPIRKRHAKN